MSLSAASVNYPYQDVTLTVKTREGYIPNGIYPIRITANGKIFGCYINVTNTSKWRIFQLGNSGAPSYILQDNENNYWCSKYYDARIWPGIYKISAKNASKFWLNSSNQSIGGQFTVMAIDRKNNKKYFGGKDGVTRSDDKNITLYNITNSPIPDNKITAIAIDDESTVWIGTNNGLARLQGNTWTVFNSTNSALGAEPITGIALAGTTMWIGTRNGLVKYDGATWSRISPSNSSMPAPFVWSMAVDGNGDLWAGLGHKIDTVSEFGGPDTMIGLARYDGTNWNLYNNTNSPMTQSHYVNSIAIDKKGNKWVATSAYYFLTGSPQTSPVVYPCGLLKFDNNTWTAYNKTNSPLYNDDVGWVGLDNADNLWFSGIVSSQRYWGVFNEAGLPPFLFAPPTSVEEQPEATDGITIYPNPTNTSFTISGADNILSVKIMNSLGMEISRKSLVVSGTVEVDVADLASGIYFVQMRTPTGIITKSIVVSR